MNYENVLKSYAATLEQDRTLFWIERYQEHLTTLTPDDSEAEVTREAIGALNEQLISLQQPGYPRPRT